ncbi:MAG: hypothetical protein WDO56_14835 [Gammaproteobacteria bacterium]
MHTTEALSKDDPCEERLHTSCQPDFSISTDQLTIRGGLPQAPRDKRSPLRISDRVDDEARRLVFPTATQPSGE